jgi:uncharacterized membrane protein YeaQ/YmgE (transglycosylase-associated protein family)
MGVIASLVIGGLIGWLASKVMKTDAQMGVLANVVVGVVGSALGFWVAGLLGLAAYGALGRLLVSIGGAVLLIAILRKAGLVR